MTDLLVALLELNIAAAVAILAVLVIRKRVARHLGPHASYALWTVVPVVMAATLVPGRTQETFVTEFLVGGVPASMAAAGTDLGVAWLGPLLLTIWLAGALLAGALLVRRQVAFLRDAEIGLAGPAVVGFRHPRIVTPSDFGQRFSHDERKLILTHEQVHIDRNDGRINALAAVARCLFWFNPLVHAGARALRVDQELSCDAEVIERRPRTRRVYAETLLKTHLAARPLPAGCYWPSEAQHPLAERIDLIARKPISTVRQIAAAGLVVSVVAGAGFAAWAAQPARTIFRETADVLIPFRPISREEVGPGNTQPARLVPASFVAPALPAHWRRNTEIVADLCLSETGAVERVALVTTSSDRQVDAAAIRSLERAHFEPATRNGQPVALCGQKMTIAFTQAAGSAPP